MLLKKYMENIQKVNKFDIIHIINIKFYYQKLCKIFYEKIKISIELKNYILNLP